MADRRKLQGEVDRCLKKVSEGVETFIDTWKKVQNATNSNQKEKYEGDLKKEIKKLQRLRDQIKTWLTSSDIKDKRNLQEARKLIETQMERFKIVERETKTKAYSKEGLGAAQKLDPAQREKEEIQVFLTACIDALNIQVDKFESEIDSINFSLKKKKNDKEKLDRLEDLKQRTSKHKYHVNQLEALLRMLDNGTVEVDQIKKIKDDIEYYRDCSQDPDFQENEFMYDDLNLEDLEDYLAKQQAAFQQNELDMKNAAALEEEGSTAVSNSPTTTSTNSPSPSPCLENHSSEEMKVSDSTSTNSIPPSISPTLNNTSEGSNPAVSHVNFNNSQPVINSQTSSTPYATAAAGLPNSHYKVSNNHESTWSSSTSVEEELNEVNHFQCPNSSDGPHGNANPLSKSFVPGSGPWTDSNFGGRYQLPENNLPQPVGMQCDSSELRVFNSESSQLVGSSSDNKNLLNCQNDSMSFVSPANISSSKSVILDDAQSSLKNLAERAVLNSGMSNHIHNLQFSALQNKGSQLTHNILGNNTNDMFIETSKPSPAPVSTEINVTQIFGTFPQNTYSHEEQQCLKALEVAVKRLPLAYDCQRYRYNSPGSPTPTPDYYPKSAPNGNTLEFFQRLSTETLFFIFYFFQGTKAQYLAARSLKTKSWRFHTMFMMWFQRHEEPKTITDDYEQGTYVYFDYEKWMQRKKEGFTFEYKYLEDKELN